jgi:hypothetical protein
LDGPQQGGRRISRYAGQLHGERDLELAVAADQQLYSQCSLKAKKAEIKTGSKKFLSSKIFCQIK